jgi:hypothetical protein
MTGRWKVGAVVAVATVLLLAMPARSNVFNDDDVQRLAVLDKRLQQLHLDYVQTLLKDDASESECAFSLIGEASLFTWVVHFVQEIVGLSTKMVDTIDERTVLEAFHKDAIFFISYVDQTRKLHMENMQRPANQRVCPQTAAKEQQLRDLQADLAALIKDMESRVIGLTNKR